MSLGLDFLDDSDDLEQATDAVDETVEVSEEAENSADEADTEAAQEEQTEQDADEKSEDEQEPDVIDLDGEEVTLEQIRQWKSGNLREQDYTKKTMALADERKAVSAKLGELNSIHEVLNAGEAEFKKALLGDLDDVDLKALRNDDYVEYQRTLEERKEREAKFDELKANAAKARNAYVQEQGKQLNDLMGWSDKSKSESDIKAFKAMADDIGISEQDAASLSSAKVMKALIDYAHLKNKANATPPKGKTKKVAFKKSSTSNATQTKNKTAEERLNSFFS